MPSLIHDGVRRHAGGGLGAVTRTQAVPGPATDFAASELLAVVVTAFSISATDCAVSLQRPFSRWVHRALTKQLPDQYFFLTEEMHNYPYTAKLFTPTPDGDTAAKFYQHSTSQGGLQSEVEVSREIG